MKRILTLAITACLCASAMAQGEFRGMPLSDSVSFFTACGMMWYLVIRLRKKHAAEEAN